MRGICQVEGLEDGGILGNEKKRNLVGPTPGIKKSSRWGRVPRDCTARKQKGKLDRGGSLESKDLAYPRPLGKRRLRAEQGLPGIQWVKLRTGLRMLCLGGRKQESWVRDLVDHRDPTGAGMGKERGLQGQS